MTSQDISICLGVALFLSLLNLAILLMLDYMENKRLHKMKNEADKRRDKFYMTQR